MLRSHTPLRLIPCTLLLVVSISGESQRDMAHSDTPGTGRMDDQRVLEAVKKEILSSLNMDREPRPTQKASRRRLNTMYELYRERIYEMEKNSSQSLRDPWRSTMTTVLYPSLVEPLKGLQKSDHQQLGQRIQWYRARFQNKTKIQTELILTQAQLKISRRFLDKLSSFGPEVRREIKIRVNGMKPTISTVWNDASSAHTDSSRTQDMILDVRPEVNRWMGTDGQSLVVDVGIVLINKSTLKANLTDNLELSVIHSSPARRTRPRRSSKEDSCDERGWCCRKSVTVSFKDIGWTDWVLAPAEYTMHFCEGTCPHNYKPASMHTQIKSRMHQISKGMTPRPCCVPAAYEPMVLLHYDSRGKLKLTPFSDLIVSKCHCA